MPVEPLVPEFSMRIGGLLLVAMLCAGCARSTDENGRTALMRAAAAGDVSALRRQARLGADVDQQVKDHSAVRYLVAFLMWMQQLPERREGWTALYFAVDSGRVEAARELIDMGAGVNHEAGFQTPLTLALRARQPNRELLELLIRSGADPDAGMTETPLLLAISRRDSALVGMLLAAGADPNHAARGAAPLLVAMQIGYAPVVRQLVVAGANPDVRDRRTGWTPLTWALHRNDSTLAALLQGAGADPNAVPDHALLKAVEAGDLDALRRALAAGASPAAQTERGQPAIVVAAGNGHEAMVFALLDAGARVPPDQGGAMLYTAAFHGADSVVKYLLSAGIAVTPHHLGAAAAGGQEVTVRVLLEAGADPNGEYGHPLREAIRGRNADVVSLLVSAGADVTFTTNRGMDPLAYAVQSGQADAVRVLLEAGADATRARATPLMMTALYSGDTLLMGTLLDRGAPIDARDTRGQTALDAARRMTYRPELAAYLERQVAVRGTGGKEP